MKRLKKVASSFFMCIVILLFSCTNNFKELSINPNSSQNALPHSLLAPAITDVVVRNMSRSKRINNELMQVHVLMGDVEGRIFRYDLRKSEADYLWNYWFVQLTNFKDMYHSAQELYNIEQEAKYNTYMGIAIICHSWVSSMLTDTYGDMPYFEASKGREGVLMPKFDTQKEIYTDLFVRLNEANELLKRGIDLPEDESSSDPIYHGNAAKWRKFGNSLLLRLLLRVSDKEELVVKDEIQRILVNDKSDYPLMQNNDDSAILRWTGVVPYQSPFYTLRDPDWRLVKLAEFFVNNLNEWGDPRIEKWATKYEGSFAGIPSGYPVGEAPTSKSMFPIALKTEALLGNIMNYSEVEFILAELSIKGYINSDAKTHYENAVTSHINLWGFELPENYFQRPSLKWDNNESIEDKMAKIHNQKYYALFFTDLQQWFEYRRTGFPFLSKGAGLMNNGEMPARLNYPIYIQSTNRENYQEAIGRQGVDDINIKVWWQRPN